MDNPELLQANVTAPPSRNSTLLAGQSTDQTRGADPAPTIVRVATAGEALIDLIGQPDGRFDACLGGAVFNLTRALALQGIGTLYLNPFSGDRFGRQLVAAMLATGAQLAATQPSPATTSLAVVGLTPAGHPDYAFYRDGVADRDVTAQGLIDACQAQAQIELVCTGALALDPLDAERYLPWLEAQRAAGRLIVIDANLRPSAMRDLAAYRANVRAALALADVIKVSDEDLAHLQAGGDTVLARARQVLQASPARLLILTQGEHGAHLLTRAGEQWHAREAVPLAVVDTVGAGDCFLAGFVAALLAAPPEPRKRMFGASPLDLPLGDAEARRLLSYALASGSLCVMQRGCVPPTHAAVAARVAAVPCTFA